MEPQKKIHGENDLQNRIDQQIKEIREDYRCIGALMKYLKETDHNDGLEHWSDIIRDYTELMLTDIDKLLTLKKQIRTDKVLDQLFNE